ncbi:PH domain-containing protein [Maribacter halichondriae]|uniref:PH domain-containing protein n=1 Tax=Maribacter halichondriae TaxID=2980554 RepID=UPI0023582E02|nr:PH domain-containing protein [Maribacter sp. Hal144]
MTRYRSKIGIGIFIFLVLVLGGTTLQLITKEVWLGVVINVLVIAFVAHLFLNTSYIVDGNVLVVKSSFIVHKSIDIRSITTISETNNPISAPAASLDRLEISYGSLDNLNSIFISPKDKVGFINHLQKINPNIKII